MSSSKSRVLGLALGVIALGALTGPASGDGDPVADAQTRAAEADALAKSGDFLGAATAFKAALALDPRAEYQCNVGVAYWKARDLPRAQLYLGLCLTRGSHLPESFLASVRQVLAAVEERLKQGEFAPVDIVVTPAAAEVRVASFDPDDRFVGSRIVWLPPGAHAIEASASGYQPSTVTITVEGTERVAAPITLEATRVPDPVLPPPGGGPSPGMGVRTEIVTAPPSRVPAYIGTGVTIAALVADVLLFRSAKDSAERAGTLPPGPEYDAAVDVAKARVDQLYAMYAVTGVAAGLTGYLWWRARPRSGKRLAVEPTEGGAAISIGGTF